MSFLYNTLRSKHSWCTQPPDSSLIKAHLMATKKMVVMYIYTMNYTYTSQVQVRFAYHSTFCNVFLVLP